eukprot:GHVP01061834.1.p1 GENE.GHVP01061834.1~~GHVP01061834.1.p1  ORF type:complete len:320 (-),score=36.39 GHVP01061834.1:311-1270(-)
MFTTFDKKNDMEFEREIIDSGMDKSYKELQRIDRMQARFVGGLLKGRENKRINIKRVFIYKDYLLEIVNSLIGNIKEISLIHLKLIIKRLEKLKIITNNKIYKEKSLELLKIQLESIYYEFKNPSMIENNSNDHIDHYLSILKLVTLKENNHYLKKGYLKSLFNDRIIETSEIYNSDDLFNNNSNENGVITFNYNMKSNIIKIINELKKQIQSIHIHYINVNKMNKDYTVNKLDRFINEDSDRGINSIKRTRLKITIKSMCCILRSVEIIDVIDIWRILDIKGTNKEKDLYGFILLLEKFEKVKEIEIKTVISGFFRLN